MPNNPEDITIGDGITTPVIVDNGPSDVTIGSGDTNVTIGNGQDTITAGNNDTIKVGNGPDTITIGNDDSLSEGDGQHTITAGNGTGTITAGVDSTITVGNGNNQITAGPDSTIVGGNGPDTLHVGHDTSITLGAGPDTIHAGTTDTITFNKGGPDTIDYDGLTPRFNVPASITVPEEHSIALPITLFPRNLGNEVINGFKPQNGVIAFDTRDFANTAAVLANAAQVGTNVVITQPQGSGSLTLTNTSLSSLSASNFTFFTGPDEVITITGLPADATLSAGTNDGGGTWSLTPEQLPGLVFNAGEPSGYPTLDSVTVTMTNPAGQGATFSETFPLQVTAIPPTLSETPLIYQTGVPLLETTRLDVASATDDGDSGDDYINRLQFNSVPAGVTISSPSGTVVNNGGGQWTLSTSGNPASFNPEIDISTPNTTEFNLGITTFSDEPNSPELSVSTSQNVDVIYGSANSTLNFDPGDDTAHAATSDTINLAAGTQTVAFDTLTPSFTVPGSTVNVNEENSVAIPINILPASLGSEVINGFNPASGVIGFDTGDFANAAAVFANAAQVGPNVVITQPGGGGSVTLNGISLGSLSASNFAFFGSSDTVTISGVPLDATLSAGTYDGGGTWSLTPSQLSGLMLNAGEPSGFPTADTLSVTVANNTSGHTASTTETFPLVVHAIPPTVSDSVIAYQSGDPVTETRLQLNSAVDSGDSSSDYINRIVLSGVPTGTNISSPDATVTANGGGVYTLSTSGNPASFNPEVDVTTPSNTTTNFNLGIQAFSDEPNSPELSASTSQNINVQYEPASADPTFQVNNGNMWQSGAAFSRTFNTFIGVDYPNGFPNSSGPAKASTSFLGTFKIGGSFGIKAGFQSDLTLNGGSYNATLPYDIGLANTFNKTNDTLEVDPSASQGTASLSTFSPQGSYDLSLILDALLKAFAGPISLGISTNINDTLFSFNSSQAHFTFNLPDGIGAVKVAWPTLNLSGSSSSSTVSASGISNPVLGLDIDPIAVISDIILGSDPFKGSGGFTVGLGGLHWNYTLAAGTIEPTLNLGQSFNLNVGSLGASLTDNGNSEPSNLSSPTIIQNAPASNNFDLTLTPNSTLSNDTSLASQLIFGLKLLAASGKITAGVPSLSITTTVASGSVGPLFQVSTTVNLGSVSLFQNTFPVAFGSKSANFNVS